MRKMNFFIIFIFRSTRIHSLFFSLLSLNSKAAFDSQFKKVLRLLSYLLHIAVSPERSVHSVPGRRSKGQQRVDYP